MDASGQFRSMRYGFIEFDDHQYALSVLRKINNNPNIFGANNRPIVEFALDDVRYNWILFLIFDFYFF